MRRIFKTLFFMTALLPLGTLAKISVTNPIIFATQQAGIFMVSKARFPIQRLLISIGLLEFLRSRCLILYM